MLDGRLYGRDERVSQEDINEFFMEDDIPEKVESGYHRDLPTPWDCQAYWLVKYFTLDNHFVLLYGPHSVLLKHFRNGIRISFPYFLLH